MNTNSLIRAVLAGFIATLAMTFLGFIAGHLGAPSLNWASAFSGLFGGSTLMGYFLFFMVGVLMAVFYVGFFHDRLPGNSWKRGVFFAVLMWLATGLIFAPVFKMGFFMGSVMVAMGTLFSYMVYGIFLGFIYDA